MTLNLSPERRVWIDETPGEECGQWGQYVHWPCGGGHVGELEEPCGCSPASTDEFRTGDRIGKTEMKLPVHRQGPLELGWPSCWDQTASRKSRESIKKDWNFPSCDTLECSRVSNYLNMSFNQASFLAVDVIYGGLFNWALVFPTELYYLSSPQVWPVTGRGDLWFPTWKPLRIVIVKNRGLGPNLSYWIIILFFSHRLHKLFCSWSDHISESPHSGTRSVEGHTTSAQISSRASVFCLLEEIPAGQEVYFTYVFFSTEKPKQTCWPTQ